MNHNWAVDDLQWLDFDVSNINHLIHSRIPKILFLIDCTFIDLYQCAQQSVFA